MKTQCELVLVTLLAAFAAVGFAADYPDSMLTLRETPLPVFGDASRARVEGVAANSGSGIASGAAAGWEIVAHSVGRIFSDTAKTQTIGDWCRILPDAPSNINWTATYAWIREHEAGKEGKVALFPGASNRLESILFTAGGKFMIEWQLVNGEAVESTYTVANQSGGRPFRLYATRYGEDNSAAFIDLSGKYVNFFGDPNIVSKKKWQVEPSGAGSNVVWGLDYNSNGARMLTARYLVNDEQTLDYDCPQGQFVLAYYSTDRKDQMIASVVVEITPPNVNVLRASVGEELRPEGGGWDVSDLQAVVKTGTVTDSSDPYSPYAEMFSAPAGTQISNPKHGRIYAIAPTDASTSTTGVAMPWKLDIYWTSPDPMGTRWTFENDQYLVSWPGDAVKVVVSGDVNAPGRPWMIPTNYVVRAMTYREPIDLKVGADSLGVVTVGGARVEGASKFLLKLMTPSGDDVWYLPSETWTRANPSVASAGVFPWVIGREVTPITGDDAGTARAAAATVNPAVPGYIFEAASLGRNWNPRLYHEPNARSELNQGIAGTTAAADPFGGSTDPFAKLDSAIYFVNEGPEVEVWWCGAVKRGTMPVSIPYPALVQRYSATWAMTEVDGLLPEIAILSPDGSGDTNLTAFAGRSVCFTRPDGRGVLLNSPTVSESARTAFGFAAYVPAGTGDFAGHLARLDAGGVGQIDIACRGEQGVLCLETKVVIDQETETRRETFPFGTWNECSVALPDEFRGVELAISLGADGAGGTNAVQGVMLDAVALTLIEPDAGDLFRFKFAADDLTADAEGVRTAYRSGYALQFTGADIVESGASEAYDGRLRFANDVTPEIYSQSDRTAIGYNPNEEHAFLARSGDDYVVYALRNDLNRDDSSHPLVMAMQARPMVNADGALGWKGELKAFRVVFADLVHPEPACTAIVGERMLVPAPLGRLDGETPAANFALSGTLFDDACATYTDRKHQMWARRDGLVMAYYHYAVREGFCFPSLPDDAQIPVGTVIPWMNCRDVAGAPTRKEITENPATPYAWTVSWPNPELTPTMRIGQTLTKAAADLPEVWNAASMAVVYPCPNPKAVSVPTNVVELIDPTVVQSAALRIEQDFPGEYGFTLGSSGTVTLRKGCYYFAGTPASVSDRFYIDPNAEESKRMNLLGRYVEKESGGSYLEINILTDAERAALKALCTKDANDANKLAWDKAVDQLATKQVEATVRLNASVEGYVMNDILGDPEVQQLSMFKGFSAACQSLNDRIVRIKDSSHSVDYVFPSRAAYERWKTQIVKTPWVVMCYSNRWSFATERLEMPQLVTTVKPEDGDLITQQATWREDSVAETVISAGECREQYYLSAYARQLATQSDPSWARDFAWSNGVVRTEGRSYSPVRVRGRFSWKTGIASPATLYRPKDHYALVASGDGSGWVTLIENDNPDATEVNEGLPVSMHVIRVVPELYADGIAVITDPLNKLSEQLTLLYRTPLGDRASNFEFQWKYTTPRADGTVPADKDGADWHERAMDRALVSILLGTGADMRDYVNTYYTLRYRPRAGTTAFETLAAARGTRDPDRLWSAWADEQLAEGWLQRVLNSVTPFAQRLEDFYSNPSDIGFTMLEQIGRPYQGDVALNNDNLREVGLLELYQTLFNRMESILIASGTRDVDLSKQLLLATTRLGEFYSILGAEAYADAKNPLIAAGEGGQIFPAGTFAFANQVQSLLDEELALLRGRSSAVAYPRMTDAPCYNRLLWNLTKGLTEGEPAYVANYGIRARDGILDVNCAAAQYPQGHGDAWGHYLSGLKGYYRLLRNPVFDWTASMGEMLLDQTTANVDYQDEQKFADLAVKMVQTGVDVVDLTVRKAYRDHAQTTTAAYFDADTREAFGVGEWATRTGQGALYGWLTANAMLPPPAAATEEFVDRGIRRIDRTTVRPLRTLCTTMRTLQRKLADYEGGLNPLGLSPDTVPFDIDPDRLAEKDSHFEQILERAERSLANCKAVLDYASVYGSMLSQIQSAETSAAEDRDRQEQAYDNQLIAIYGTPFPGDIGPGGTYPQGYEGPDIYNYNCMDLGPYGLDTLVTRFTNIYDLVWTKHDGLGGYQKLTYKQLEELLEDPSLSKQIDSYLELVGKTGADTVTVPYDFVITAGGIRSRTAAMTGTRATEGTIQTAYRNYLLAYQDYQNAETDYQLKLLTLAETYKSVKVQIGRFTADTLRKLIAEIWKSSLKDWDADTRISVEELAMWAEVQQSVMTSAVIPQTLGVGTTAISDPRSVKAGATMAADVASLNRSVGTLTDEYWARNKATEKAGYVELLDTIVDLGESLYDTYTQLKGPVQSAVIDVDAAIMALQPKIAALASAEAAYRAEVYKGQQLQEERRLWREQVSNQATRQRYLDMYNRVQRNLALTKYTTAFDTAQRYVWELAKVYDYETGLLSEDAQAGSQFLADIIATRSLGQEGVAIDSATTDGGLYDIVRQLKENWSVLKPRLGINNPDKPEKWFSLRRECFRIKEGEDGDAAWRKELAKYRVDNLLADSEFVRHCQPMASANAVVFREPGYIIPFSTSINNAENFFGRPLRFGDNQFSSADYATKIAAVGVDLVGIDRLKDGAGVEPNIYLVPVGSDYMRSPAGYERRLLRWNVVDQVLPLPYPVGATQLDDPNWISTFAGLDGTSDSAAVVRRHSTMRAGADFKSTRLVGRSAWNDRWLLVIPASAFDADREQAMKLIESGVQDIRLGIRAYARQGN